MIANEADARAYCAKIGTGQQLQKLELFCKLLEAENGSQNLVAAATIPMMWQRHIADSAQLLHHVPRETMDWLDLGSGAGLPGMVIAVLRTNCTVHLVELRRKRIEWLKRVRSELELPNCEIHGTRVEKLESFEVGAITARAFAPLPKLLELSSRFSTHSTAWVLPKGRSAGQELEGLPRHQRQMFHVEQSITDDDAGIIVGTGRPQSL